MRLTSRTGLLALFESADLNQLELTETDLGFALAPRLNAQGRFSEAAESVELLTTNDRSRAIELANQLEGMNARRKLDSRLVEDAVRIMLEREPSLLDYAAIVLSHPDWSGGIVGLVANRLAEKYGKPVVLLAERDDLAIGAARSVEGVDIAQALGKCSDLLGKFGGRAKSASLTLRRENLLDFRRRFSRVVREMHPEPTVEPTLEIDGYLGLDEISLALVGDLRRLAPFGNGNPPLTIATLDLRVARKKKLGRRGDHLELTVEDANKNRQRVFWWNAGDVEPPAGRFDLAYTLRISHYQDRVEPMLELIDIRLLESEPIDIEGPKYVVEDLRRDPNPTEKLAEILAQYPDAIVWREDDAAVDGRNRTELEPAETLIVWTTPPGPQEWESALEKADPVRIFVFGSFSPEPSLESFIQRLGGLLKHAISAKEGETTIDALAAAMAQRADTVRYGLLWFDRTGRLSVDLRKNGKVRLSRRKESSGTVDQPQLEKLIRGAIAETNAYRKSWMN
jgi:single-stranded-DNA-specific exonuclease